jgi:DNA-directed RNA polymerase II subunit RPB2
MKRAREAETVEIESKRLKKEEKEKNEKEITDPNEIARYLSDPEAKRVLRGFMQGHGLLQTAIESYNHFIKSKLKEIIFEKRELPQESESKCEKMIFYINHMHLEKPTVRESDGSVYHLMPNEARIRKLSYSATVYLSFTFTILNRANRNVPYTVSRTIFQRHKALCNIPVMVRSIACHLNDILEDDPEHPLDEGGYFIISGTEKTIIMQDEASTNVPFVKKETPNNGKFSHVCEIRSLPEGKMRSTSTLYIRMSAQRGGIPPSVILNIPFLPKSCNIPLFAMFRMLHVNSKEEMTHYILSSSPSFSNSTTMSSFATRLSYLVSCILNDESQGTEDMTYEEILQFVSKHTSLQMSPEQRIRSMQHLIANEVLPHMGTDQTSATYHAKAVYLGYSIHKLLLVYDGILEPDERDEIRNKRFKTPAFLISLLFRQHYVNFTKSILAMMHKSLEKGKPLNPNLILNPRKLTSNIQYPFATGNWGVQKGGSTQTGVSQLLRRITHNATISQIRQINTPISRAGKMSKPRQLSHGHWNIMCPAETPEGESCGLMQNLSLTAHIRIGSSSKELRQWLLIDLHSTEEFIPLKKLTFSSASAASSVATSATTTSSAATTTSPFTLLAKGGARVFVNGILLGFATNANKLLADLNELRQNGFIASDVTIYYHSQNYEIWISTDAGEASRPVFILKNLYKLKKVLEIGRSYPNGLYNLLFSEGILQYMSRSEERMYLVAPSVRHIKEFPDSYTHLEIHPCTILGICANFIPFPEHNQSPRNMYEAAMQKQRISASMNTWDKFYVIHYMLHYAQKPLVGTYVDEIMHGSEELPGGANCIVAVLTYTGYNVEDAIIMNQSSIDRGLFSADVFRTYRDEESNHVDGPKFYPVKPSDKTVSGLRCASYDALEDDGLPAIGAKVNENDALIGKVTFQQSASASAASSASASAASVSSASSVSNGFFPSSTTATTAASCLKKDLSTCVKSNETTQVSAVIKTVGKDDRAIAIVQTRSWRPPEIGDKLSSHHGQKGVIGMVYRQEDMPFTSDGVVPDLIVNPHGFPSRMTLGQQLEMILGKAVAVSGLSAAGEGTAFQNDMHWERREDRIEATYELLKQYGFQPEGKETMYNGFTGERLQATVFICPVQYQRLKHMVCEKIHSRSRGPCAMLTRQPTEGRSRDGGLRVGEMEVDNMISHGAAELTKDRLFEQSDAYEVHFCTKCGLLAQAQAMSALAKELEEATAMLQSAGTTVSNPILYTNHQVPSSSLYHERQATKGAQQQQQQQKKQKRKAEEVYYCSNCQTGEYVIPKTIPYATKLFFQELYGMHISARGVFKPISNETSL